MNAGELRKRLEGIAPDTEVVIYREVEHKTNFYQIESVSLHTGKPLRHPDGKPGFTFDSKGPETWLLISAVEE